MWRDDKLAPMRRSFRVFAAIGATVSAFAAEEPKLPGPEGDLSQEIEPPVLFQNLATDDAKSDPRSAAAIEQELARAQKRAGSADRLVRAGIIAKVEAEERALQVVLLESLLAEARLAEAQASATKTNEPEMARLTEAARIATERRHSAEVEAATRNLQRQKKLLALGSARKSDVQRAEEKLSRLQRGD